MSATAAPDAKAPSMEQLTRYARALPDLYKRIFWAFPSIQPGRKSGDSLSVGSLARYFQALNFDFDTSQVEEACRQLEEHGLLQHEQSDFFQPTEVGERLIGVVSGQWAPRREIPKLPTPDW